MKQKTKGLLAIYSALSQITLRVVSALPDHLSDNMVGQQFTPQERAFLVRVYIETGSHQEAMHRFQHEYTGRQPPSPSTIYGVIKTNT